MSRKFVSLTLAILVIASSAWALSPAPGDEAESTSPTVAVQRVSLPYPVVRDEVTMILIGTALIALAAALRRAD